MPLTLRLSRFASSLEAGDAWPSWVIANQRRRHDPFTRASCAVVERLLGQGGPLSPDTALVVSTSYGSVDSTQRFVNSIAEFGDAGASPTPFTTSVHNSCAGALDELLHLHGPSTTISQGGTGTIAALRWAQLILAAGRAPAVLVVVGDQHNAWSREMVAALSNSRWPIGSGAAAALIEPGDGAGRMLKLGGHGADATLDGGALLPGDERMLALASGGQRRLVAPELLGAWWPCCLFTALPWHEAGSLQLREIESGQMAEAWLGPLRV